MYDFGDRVSVGYTAGEIAMLHRSPAHKNGTVYQIYRVDERGGLELRGVVDGAIAAREAICFLRRSGADARRDYESIQQAAYASPLSCEAELRLVRSPGFKPPDLTAIIYPAWASPFVAGWLGRLTASPGDQVQGGTKALHALESPDSLSITTCRLPSILGYADRLEAEVLASTDLSLQR